MQNDLYNFFTLKKILKKGNKWKRRLWVIYLIITDLRIYDFDNYLKMNLATLILFCVFSYVCIFLITVIY